MYFDSLKDTIIVFIKCNNVKSCVFLIYYLSQVLHIQIVGPYKLFNKTGIIIFFSVDFAYRLSTVFFLKLVIVFQKNLQLITC